MIKNLKAKLDDLANQPTDDQLDKDIADTKKQIDEIPVSDIDASNVTQKEIDKQLKLLKNLEKKNTKRVKATKELLAVIKENLAENLGYDKNELENELDITWKPV